MITSPPLVLIDGHMLGRHETGNEAYVAGLLHGLAAIGSPQVVVVGPDVAAAAASETGQSGGQTLDHELARSLRAHRLLPLPGGSDARRLLVDLPRAARRLHARVLHCTYFPPPSPPCATVVTVHDVSFLRHPEWFTLRDRAVLNAGVRLAARRAQRLLLPSEHTRREIMELLGVSGDRLVVIPDAAGEQFRPVDETSVRAVAARHGIRGPYVLALANRQPRKNLRRLLLAWRELVAAGRHNGCVLVLAGGLRGREESLADLLADPGLAATVTATGYVPHGDLPALYSGAQAFVFPSLDEGFGLPVLEAMACGTPVAAANAASLPEVAGDAAVLFDPLDTGAIAAALAAVLADARLRAALRDRGLTRAATFTWAACAGATLAAYEAAAAEAPGRPRAMRSRRAAGNADAGAAGERPGAADTEGDRQTAGPPLRIALIGTRGVPAAYSGFETAVENLGSRLAARGHDVVVYCRPHMVEGRYSTYKGIHLVYVPTIASKHLDTFVHSFLSTLHMGFFRRRDAAIYFIAGNAPFAGLSRLLGIPSAINVDGLDSHRAKWSGPARHYIRWAEHNAPRLADAVITDSRVLQRIYRDEHHADTLFIPYGADMSDPTADDALARHGLRSGGYLLFVGRLVPENNAHVLLEAYAGLDTTLDLVIVGDAPYSGEYIERLHERGVQIERERAAPTVANDAPRRVPSAHEPTAPPAGRVVFTGYLFGAGYRELASGCAVFCIPTEVGGTHPVLVEAMAAGACIVVNDHEPNIEVLGDAGESYHGARGAPGLAAALGRLLADPAHMDDLRGRARERAARLYSWDAVSNAYEDLARRLAGPSAADRRD